MERLKDETEADSLTEVIPFLAGLLTRLSEVPVMISLVNVALIFERRFYGAPALVSAGKRLAVKA